MSNIALYDLLRRIPDATDEEAKAAVADIAKKDEVATKSDIKGTATKLDIAELKTEMADINTKIANLETRLVKHTYSMAGVVVAAIIIVKFL